MSLINVAASLLAGVAMVGLAAVPTAEVAAAPRNQQPAKFDGGEVFRTYCAVCHGEKAKGDGPLAAGLKKAPPDLTQFRKQNQGTFPRELVAKIIDGREPVNGHGGKDMPVWGEAFSRSLENSDPESVKEKIQALVDYIESVQQK